MKDFQDLTDPRMNEEAWRAHDLLRAYAARDRAAIVEHLAHLEADQLEFARGVTANFYHDTLQMLRDTGRPYVPASLGTPCCKAASAFRAGESVGSGMP
ncbi:MULTISPECIES: hypothetical protein [unclassified Streptomyces]|uniref:hypothetical protein n=1 Tax=unclassified Streptomyces TaxID=2593676 RepID=UPI0036494840